MGKWWTPSLRTITLADGRVVGFCTDITERKQTRRSWSTAGARFRRLSSMTSDLVYSCRRDEDGPSNRLDRRADRKTVRRNE